MPASDNPRAQPIVAFDICFRRPEQVQRLRCFQRLKRAFPVNDAVQDVQHMGLGRKSLRQCLLDGSQRVRRCLRGLAASLLSQPASFSAKASSLLGRSGVENSGSIVPDLECLRIVLRDRPVRRAISRIGSPSRGRILRMTFIVPCGSLRCPPRSLRVGRVTWVKSQWKLSTQMGQF